MQKNVLNDIVYAPVSSWEKHTLDLYYPSTHKTAPTSRPIIVFVHGGAWRTGDKSGFVDLASNLAESTGNVVAVINYTLSIAITKDGPTSVPSKAQHPKHVQDIASALGYLYTHSQEHGGYNPDRFYLVGHSAGGQITGLLALRPDLYLMPVEIELGLTIGTLHKAIHGVIGVEGIYNVHRLLRVWPSYSDFVIQGFGHDPNALIHGSPDGQWVPSLDFTLPHYAIIQSNQDELVDPAQAKDYFKYLQSVSSDSSRNRVVIEFGDWGSHDAMLQTPQFIKTITKYIHEWESQQ
ncbi:Kynurenine formamidase [Mortierella polycephala]|uniref:Kynurenine formamidase n=1 Tax=Mortierella polycephala TaxID=41804 RepID=A0A9P6PM85_9FUNG|nr:Kynurenine formamidase [Mortierella polycephala]